MGEDDRNPFKGKNVVAARLGHDLVPEPRSGLPTAQDVLEREEAAKERQAKLRKMKPWQRKKYERDQNRLRLSVRIPQPLVDITNEISRRYSVSPASSASWLATVGLREWRSGRVPPPAVVSARSLRTEFSLSLPSHWDGIRVKRTFDLPPELLEDVRRLAQELRCGQSDVISWLMSIGAESYRLGEQPVREASDSIRYPFRLTLPKVGGQMFRGKKGEEQSSPEQVLKDFFGDK
jgi:hypothetical protein